MTAQYRRVQESHRPPETWLSVDEVAAELRISRMTIYRLVNKGLLPAHRVGRSIRVRERDMDAYLRSTDTTGWESE